MIKTTLLSTLILLLAAPLFAADTGPLMRTSFFAPTLIASDQDKAVSHIFDEAYGVGAMGQLKLSKKFFITGEFRHLVADGTVPTTDFSVEGRRNRGFVGLLYMHERTFGLSPFAELGFSASESEAVSAIAEARLEESKEGAYGRLGVEADLGGGLYAMVMLDVDDSFDVIAQAGYYVTRDLMPFIRGEVDAENDFWFATFGLGYTWKNSGLLSR